MPTYDYSCEKCGHFEHFQRITEAALNQCPSCGGSVTRLISKNVGVIFKASGFYTTDTRSTKDSGSGSGKDTAKESSEKSA